KAQRPSGTSTLRHGSASGGCPASPGNNTGQPFLESHKSRRSRGLRNQRGAGPADGMAAGALQERYPVANLSLRTPLIPGGSAGGGSRPSGGVAGGRRLVARRVGPE